MVHDVPSRALVPLALVLLVAATQPVAAAAPGTTGMDDEQFLTLLESTRAEDGDHAPELDQRRLAKLLFSIGATLGSGKANVRLLQGAMHLREADAASTREMVRARFDDYDTAVEAYRGNVSNLLDDPQSVPLLFRTLMDGHRTCWLLDAYTRLVETYGVSANDLVSILSSREACGQFRRAAFSAPVEATIARSLEESAQLEVEVHGLQQEIEELEKLVEDLRAIEER